MCILHTHQHHINYKVSVEKVGRTDVYGVGPTPCSEYIRIDLYLYKKNLMETNFSFFFFFKKLNKKVIILIKKITFYKNYYFNLFLKI